MVDGNRMVATDYDLSFRVDRDKSVLCTLKLGQDDLAAFRKAILKDYYFQFFYDDLPIWGYVGKAEAIPGTPGVFSNSANALRMEYSSLRITTNTIGRSC